MYETKKGSWLPDKYRAFINGDLKYEEAHMDGQKFYVEIDRLGNCLFPLGITNRNITYLQIKHSNPTISADLNDYFITHRNGRMFGQHFSLQDFMGGLLQQLSIYGRSFYAIDWERKVINGRPYVLPGDFRYLNKSTMICRLNRDKIEGFIQKYSYWGHLFNRKMINRRYDFLKNEVFFLTYPLDKDHPMKKSLKLIPALLRFWTFAIAQSESNVKTTSHRLDLELARNRRYSSERRKHVLARAKARKNFHWLLNVDELSITEYYDICLVCQYRKELNTFRQYFIQEFNNQVLKPLARKNRIKYPVLESVGLMTNDEIDEYFEQYCDKKITAKEFIEKVVNSD